MFRDIFTKEIYYFAGSRDFNEKEWNEFVERMFRHIYKRDIHHFAGSRHFNEKQWKIEERNVCQCMFYILMVFWK